MLLSGDRVTVRLDLIQGLKSCGVVAVRDMESLSGSKITVIRESVHNASLFPVFYAEENSFTWTYGFIEEFIKPFERLTPDFVLHCFRRLGLEPRLAPIHKGIHIMSVVAAYFSGGICHSPINRNTAIKVIRFLSHFYPVDYLYGIYRIDRSSHTDFGLTLREFDLGLRDGVRIARYFEEGV